MDAKQFLLGTAQWGWNISTKDAYSLLDHWLKKGHSKIDCATNYPINKNPNDFRAAERILADYIHAHGLGKEIAITMKIGSLDNMKSPVCNLSPSFIMMMAEEYSRIFRANLDCLMLHWDNRDDASEIADSLQALKTAAESMECRIGLSGIAHPLHYADLLQDSALKIDIQLKNNVLQSDLQRYQPLFSVLPKAKIYGYGINAGGIKLGESYANESTYFIRGGDINQHKEKMELLAQKTASWNRDFVRPPIKSMNQLGLIFNLLNPKISGIVLGVKNIMQMEESLDFTRNIETYDYVDVFNFLNARFDIKK